MPCFYCGKRVSLVRQMADADFCSEEHRKQYHALTRLALDRLLDHNQQRTTPVARPEPKPEAAAFVPSVPPPARPEFSGPVRSGGAIECPPAASFLHASQSEPTARTGLVRGPGLPVAPPEWESRAEARAPATGLHPQESVRPPDPDSRTLADPPPEPGFREEQQPGARTVRSVPSIAATLDRAVASPAVRGIAVEKIGRAALADAELIAEIRPIANCSFSARPAAAPFAVIGLALPRGTGHVRPRGVPADSGPIAAGAQLPMGPRRAESVVACAQFGVTGAMLEYPAPSRLEAGIFASQAPQCYGTSDVMGEAGPLVRLPRPMKRAAVAAPAAGALVRDVQDSVVLPAPALLPALPQGELSLRSHAGTGRAGGIGRGCRGARGRCSGHNGPGQHAGVVNRIAGSFQPGLRAAPERAGRRSHSNPARLASRRLRLPWSAGLDPGGN